MAARAMSAMPLKLARGQLGGLLGIAALVFGVAACQTVTLWLAPSSTCADWQHMTEDQRSALTEQIIVGSSFFEGVREAQHAPAGASEEELVAMAVTSITKNCEVEGWSPTRLVKDIVRDLYLPEDQGASAARFMPSASRVM